MKTVLFINASNARYFRRVNGNWHLIDRPDQDDKLWVIANLPEESLEPLQVPLLFGRDRSRFLERHLASTFPHSQYRAAPSVAGIPFKAGAVVLAGLTGAETVTRELDKLDVTIAGVWGVSMLLTLIAQRLALKNIMLVMPSAHYLRILVIKDGLPVITRCIHRYSEDSNQESDGDSNEILRTRQHLENRRIFGHDSLPPILYLGDAATVSSHLSRTGITLRPVPAELAPSGEAAYLHPLLELVTSSPRGQLAPLQLRAHHLAGNFRRAAHVGILASVLAALVFGQQDFRALIGLFEREDMLAAELKKAVNERERLAGQIGSTGKDPALVRQATKFSALEMDPVPTPESIFGFTAAAIADLPQVRIKSLTFRFPKPGDRYCQGRTVVNLPVIDKNLSFPGNKPSEQGNASGNPTRHTELQFSILLTENLPPAAQAEIRKRISSALKAREGVQLMQDPAAFSLINTLKGGFGMDTGETDNLWCMSVPWRTTPPDDIAARREPRAGEQP